MRKRHRISARAIRREKDRKRDQYKEFQTKSDRERNRIAWDLSEPWQRKAYITNHLTECARCGQTDYRLLSFHHRDRRTKRHNVKAMIWRPSTRREIDDEIAKCDVLCFNCHRLTHWEEEHPNHVVE